MKKRPPSGSAGFTLIEMIITLSIFLLLTAAVFGIFEATLRSASMLQDDRARADQGEAMGAWLKKSFLALPFGGVVLSYTREGSPFDVSDLVWGEAGQLSALDLHLQPDGRYTLRVTNPASQATADPDEEPRAAFVRQVLDDDPALQWRSLIHDLVGAKWRFRTLNDPDWQEAVTGGRPSIIEFSFQVAGAATPVVTDCWLPPLMPPPGASSAAPVALTLNP